MYCIVFDNFCYDELFIFVLNVSFRNSGYVIIVIFTVAHNSHGKTKSHGTTNLTHGKTVLSDGKTKLIHGSTQLIHGKTKLTHGRTQLIHGKTKLTHGKNTLRQNKRQQSSHGKTKKTSWSAVLICVSNGMSCNSNKLIAWKPPLLVQYFLFFSEASQRSGILNP